MTIQTTIEREGVEIPIEVVASYDSGERMTRESPEIPASFEIETAAVTEDRPGFTNGTTVELTPAETEKIEGELWKEREKYNPSYNPEDFDDAY